MKDLVELVHADIHGETREHDSEGHFVSIRRYLVSSTREIDIHSRALEYDAVAELLTRNSTLGEDLTNPTDDFEPGFYEAELEFAEKLISWMSRNSTAS